MCEELTDSLTKQMSKLLIGLLANSLLTEIFFNYWLQI